MRFLLSFLLVLTTSPLQVSPKPPPRETGEFRIIVGGRDVGSERFEIRESGGKYLSSSSVEFRNPEAANQRVRFETSLEMDAHLTPTRYQLKSEVNDKKGTITGTFSANQAMFEYASESGTRKSGLLTGKQFTLLDTNVFHHFSFLARLFAAGGSAKEQRFEVLIPQESDSGFVTVSDKGKQDLVIQGKKKSLRHLLLDTGVLQIDLWVDNSEAVQRISVPSKAVLVERRD